MQFNIGVIGFGWQANGLYGIIYKLEQNFWSG